MTLARTAFLDSLEKWIQAARADDFHSAKEHADNLIRYGEMLVIHPEFVRSFARQSPNVDAKDALLQLCQFLICVTDGKAVRLIEWVDEHRPTGSTWTSQGH